MSGSRDPRDADAAVADMTGASALPRRSGEMVFHDDWERRAFAMAVALCERGLYQWNEFRRHLVAAINGSGESPGHPDPTAPGYYEHWLASLEKVLAEKGVVEDLSAVAGASDRAAASGGADAFGGTDPTGRTNPSDGTDPSE